MKNGEDHITVFSGKLLPEELISPSSASILSFNFHSFWGSRGLILFSMSASLFFNASHSSFKSSISFDCWAFWRSWRTESWKAQILAWIVEIRAGSWESKISRRPDMAERKGSWIWPSFGLNCVPLKFAPSTWCFRGYSQSQSPALWSCHEGSGKSHRTRSQRSFPGILSQQEA